MKAVVIYNSQTGFTKKYAEWISESAGCECVEFKKAAKLNLMDYDSIVFGGWCLAGSITKLSWFKKQMPVLSAAGKKLVVFAVGATPAEAEELKAAMDGVFTEEEKSMAKLFYCPGGINYDKMKGPSRFAMKMLSKALASKKDATEDELKKAELISKSYDISDKKFIEPILKEIM